MSWWKKSLLGAVVLGGLLFFSVSFLDIRSSAAPPATTSDVIPGRYVVVLRDGVDPDGFANAMEQVRIKLSGNAGSFTLNPEGGCS